MVQPVKGFIQKEEVGLAGQRQHRRGLAAHALGEGAKVCLGVELEGVGQLAKARAVEAGIERSVGLRHAQHICLRQKVQFVRHEHKLFLQPRIFIDIASIQRHIALVRAVNAADQAQQRRFACAVGADQAVDAAGGNGAVQCTERGKITEFFGESIDLYHREPPWAALL